jgi:uncharacterized protein YdeI (YjbR/CyaY-like superfamily)
MKKTMIPAVAKVIPRVTPTSTTEWRNWLQKNHCKHSMVEFVRYKAHTEKNSMTHQELMDEAICFGWIDTTSKRLDEDRYLVKFAKRTPRANWSKNTLSYAERLLKAGKMAPQGIAAYELAKTKPAMDAHIPDNPVCPPELKAALETATKKVNAAYEALPPSAKKMYHRWILRAKQEETRKKRAAQLVEGLKIGKKPFDG